MLFTASDRPPHHRTTPDTQHGLRARSGDGAPSESSAPRPEVAGPHIGPGAAALLRLAGGLAHLPVGSVATSMVLESPPVRSMENSIGPLLRLQHAPRPSRPRRSSSSSMRAPSLRVLSQQAALGPRSADRRSSRRGSAPRARSAPRMPRDRPTDGEAGIVAAGAVVAGLRARRRSDREDTIAARPIRCKTPAGRSSLHAARIRRRNVAPPASC